jgi:pimeloyl-ACP methyl ester carboxylesterase
MCAEARKLVVKDTLIPSRDSGIRLFIRNKRPAGIDLFGPEKTLLYVHGSTYPAESTFDLPLAGLSWMDYIASQGWDVFLVDLRGYGGSSRPAEMDEPASNHSPIVTTEVALRDVGAAVDYVLRIRKLSTLNLLGWSWGATLMGAYTAQNNNDRVRRLVLYAPQWLWTAPTSFTREAAQGAYRTVTMEQARQRWIEGVPENKKSELVPQGWFEQAWEAALASDAVGSQQTPPVLRAPNGTLHDSRTYWGAGKPYYDPTQIAVPTLVVHAEWDADLPTYMAHGVFNRLTNALYRRFVELGEGTHSVMLEKNRMQLFREVQLFLDEPPP